MSEALKVCVLSRSQLGWPWRAKKTIPVRINWFVRCFGERLYTCSEIDANTAEDVSST